MARPKVVDEVFEFPAPEPSRMEDFIQLQDELIMKMAVPSEMLKGGGSQAAARVHQEIMMRRLGTCKR